MLRPFHVNEYNSYMERVVSQIEDVFADLPTLETPRLLLRKMHLEDARDLYEYATDPAESHRGTLHDREHWLGPRYGKMWYEI